MNEQNTKTNAPAGIDFSVFNKKNPAGNTLQSVAVNSGAFEPFLSKGMKTTFTKTELDILNHRLEVSDCIADAVTDGDDCKWTWEEVSAEATMLKEALTAGLERETLTDLQRVILRDCMIGSTYFGYWDEMTASQRMTGCKAAYSLQAKLNAIGVAGQVTMH